MSSILEINAFETKSDVRPFYVLQNSLPQLNSREPFLPWILNADPAPNKPTTNEQTTHSPTHSRDPKDGRRKSKCLPHHANSTDYSSPDYSNPSLSAPVRYPPLESRSHLRNFHLEPSSFRVVNVCILGAKFGRIRRRVVGSVGDLVVVEVGLVE